jgi:hypothetical protein
MQIKGWSYLPGDDLITWYYVHPSVAKMKKRDMLRQCTKDVHYFTTTPDLHRYAKKHLGWAGEGTTSPPTSSGTPITSRVDKRKQSISQKSNVVSSMKRSRASLEGTVRRDGTLKQYSVSKTTPLPSKREVRETINSSQNKNPCSNISDSISNDSQTNPNKEMIAEPDKQLIISDKLDCCQLVLHPCYKKDKLTKAGLGSAVALMEDGIKDFMRKAVKTGKTMDGMIFPSPGFLYICGGPGTGKVSPIIALSSRRTFSSIIVPGFIVSLFSLLSSDNGCGIMC